MGPGPISYAPPLVKTAVLLVGKGACTGKSKKWGLAPFFIFAPSSSGIPEDKA